MTLVSKGTGDGGGLIGRKLISFVLYVLALTGFVFVTGKMELPSENVQIQGMWMITYCGLFLVGGQALIDSLVPIFTRWADAYASSKNGQPMQPPKGTHE